MLTIKKKRPEAEATPTVAATAAPLAPPIVPAGLEPPAAAEVAAGGASASSFTVFAMLGIAVVLCVAAVLALQYTEFAFYKASPSVWPAP